MKRRIFILAVLVATGVALTRKMAKAKKPAIVLQTKHYTAKAAVVWCFDARASSAYRQFLVERGWSEDEVDLIKVAGGAHNLASPEQETDRQYLLNQIRKSVAFHGPKLVVLMNHIDCGAYGGSKAFENHDSETEFQCQELGKAQAAVQHAFPELEVQLVFLGFDGLMLLE